MSSDSRRSSALVSAGILLSRMAGLVRERAVSHFLGLGFAAEAFAAAFRIPNILQNLLGEGVLSASFIPVHVRLIDQGRDDEARQLAGTVLGLLTAAAGAVAVLLVVLAGPLASVLLLGREPGMQELVASLLRIIAPGIALLVISAWCLGILNSHRRFFLSYVAPVVWNLAQVVVVVVAGMLLLDAGAESATRLQTERLAEALAWGTLLGGALQVAVQVPVVRSLTPGLRPRLSPIGPHTREVLRAFVPVVTGRGVVQLATFVDLMLASVLVGSVLATLMKVQTLSILPVSLFGMAVAAAELPDLSSADRSDRLQLARRIDAGMGRIAFYVLPTMVGFLLIGDLIVGLLFRSGAFGAPEVRIVWVVLMGATLGLLATTSSRLLQSVLYGGGDTKGPARIAIVRVVLAAAAGFLLMVQLDRVVLFGDGLALMPGASLPAIAPIASAQRASSELVHLGALGLTLASSIAAAIEYRLLRELVAHRVGAQVRLGGPQRGRLAVAAGASAVAAVLVRPLLVDLTPVLAGIVAVGVVGTVHVSVAVALGVEEARALLATVLGRPRRS